MLFQRHVFIKTGINRMGNYKTNKTGKRTFIDKYTCLIQKLISISPFWER